MLNITQTSRSSYRFVILAALVVVLSVFFQGCVSQGCLRPSRRPISKEEAAQRVISMGEELWVKADHKKGLRIHQYGELVPKETRVTPAFTPEGKETPSLVCKNPCWLFFLDEDPMAHFAHPVRIVLIDARTGKEEVIQTDWWPQIDGKQIFETFDKRTNRETIVFDKVPELGLEEKEPGEIIGGPSRVIKSHDPCDAWAIIVCGFDDIGDTFDEDTDDMYSVLIGLGLLNDHIFFVSPHTTHTGVDRPLSVANVQWAINQVANNTDETDKVLFFYSSHGNINSLSCGSNSISAANLDTWLDAITCEELVIIIEACHSGSLIGRYANGTYVAAEDELTGDGETNRCVFTSASTNTSSYPDVDWTGDPNPGDVGSETIYGYVEAFSTASADVNSDGEISFGEGWQYAWDNDVTRIDGVNTPQMVHTGLNTNNVYDYCYRVTGDGDLFICDGPGDVGHNSHDYNSTDIWVTQDPTETDHQDVVSGMDNLVHVAVHNRGTTPIANTSLKVYWGDVSTATSWPGDFTQIQPTFTFPSLAAGATETHTWTWWVDPAIGLGHNFCLVAVADSPDDPMTGGPPGATYVAPYDNNIAQKNITIIEDPGHGHGEFQFVLKNNTLEVEKVDLVIEWIGKPWGNAVIVPPLNLIGLAKQGAISLDSLRIVDLPDGKAGLEVTGETSARMKGIPLKPGKTEIVTVTMKTKKTKPGQRSELRLHQEAADTTIGVVTVRLQEVDPADCGWVARSSVEAFSDLAHKFQISSAKEVSKRFAQFLKEGKCREILDESEFFEVFSRIHSLEVEIAKELPTRVDLNNLKKLNAELEELERSIESKDVKATLKAQGKISETVKEICK